MKTQLDNSHRNDTGAELSDAPWLVVPLLLAAVLIGGLALIFGWSASVI